MTKRKFLLHFKKMFFKLGSRLKKLFLKRDLNEEFSFSLKYFGQVFHSLKKGKLVLAIVLPLFLYYFFSFVTIGSESVCLESLRLSFVDGGVCREECYLNRLENKKCITSSFKENSKFEKKLFSYLKNESLDFSFRQEMLNILAKVYEEKGAPMFLVSYLESAVGDQKMKAEIFAAFDWEMVGGGPLSYYLAILESEASVELKLAAALKISSYNKKSVAFSVSDLETIEKVIFDDETDSYLRQSLVLLLSDYHNIFPEETAEIFTDILAANFKQDNISRAFAADFINEPLPEISQSEWDRYYRRF